MVSLLSWPAVAATPAGQVVENQADLQFTNGLNGERIDTQSNVAAFSVAELHGYTLTADQSLMAAPGDTVVFAHQLRNTGNGSDSYSLSITPAAGNQFSLADLSIHVDTNGNGEVDANEPAIVSPLALGAEEQVELLVRATVPLSAQHQQFAELQLTATSGDIPTTEMVNIDRVEVDAPPQPAEPFVLRFVMPTPALQEQMQPPQWSNDADFVDTDDYRIGIADDAYVPWRDGVWVELDAVLDSSEVLLDADGIAYVVVELTAGSRRLNVLLRETTPGSGRYRNVAAIRLQAPDETDEVSSACPLDTAAFLANPTLPSDLLTEPPQGCALVVAPASTVTVTAPSVDPLEAVTDVVTVGQFSVVFDGRTLEPVGGAVVEFHTANGLGSDALTGEPLRFTSDAFGRYPTPRLQHALSPATRSVSNGVISKAQQLARSGDLQADATAPWHLVVIPPGDYLFPSVLPINAFPSLTVVRASYGIESSLYGATGVFTAGDGAFAPVIDIPLDATRVGSVLTLAKSALEQEVEPGGLVPYSIEIANRGDTQLDELVITDTPPPGFVYTEGSSALDGVNLPDPTVHSSGDQQTLRYQLPTLEVGESIELRYLLRATVNVAEGEHRNEAVATARALDGQVLSSESSQALVNLTRPAVLSDRAIVFGKVFVDTDCNALQNDAEWPIAGVRLYMDDGTTVVTDEDGQYSLFGLRPGRHVIKVDPMTLPDGTRLLPLDNAFAADPESRFVNLTVGEMHRADFIATCPSGDRFAYLAELRERNRNLRGDWLLQDAAQFDPTAVSPLANDKQRADGEGDISNGAFGWQRSSRDDATVAAVSDSQDKVGVETPTNEQNPLDEQEHFARFTPMLAPVEYASRITRTQAQAGTWLWPENTYSTDGRFIVVIPADLDPELVVNGKPVSSAQIGERVKNRREDAQIVAWYGVELRAGDNDVVVQTRDVYGIERVLMSGSFRRPAAGVTLTLQSIRDTLPADDGRSQLPVDILIRDANGYPASGVYFVSLGLDGGSLLERDLQDDTPGTQVRVENGRARVHVRSSNTPGYLTLRAKGNGMQARLRIQQTAARRPLVATGQVNLSADWQREDDASGDNLDDEFDTHARASMFLKGSIRGGAHLTMAYDSDKHRDTELLRDINPNAFYPTFGDASVRGFEAQSRSKLYFRLDKDRSSLLWGDYLTEYGNDSNNLARSQRSLTGANAIWQGRAHRLQVFAADVADTRGLDTFRGNGTAMLYALQGAPIVPNSEVVKLIVRDENNPGFIVSERTLVRYRDYNLDAYTGLLTFRDPVPSLDENFNPVFVQVGYDLEGDGEEHLVYGLRGNYRFSPGFRVGISATRDDNDIDGSTLAGIEIEGQIREAFEYDFSVAWQSKDANSDVARAERLKLLRRWNGVAALGGRAAVTEAAWARSDTDFDNPDGGLQAGREEWRLTHEQPLGNSLTLDAEWLRSRSLLAADRQESAGVQLEKTFPVWRITFGYRHVELDTATSSDAYDAASLGLERAINLMGHRGRIGAEYEQDTSNADRYHYRVDIASQVAPHVEAEISYREQHGISESLFSNNDERQLVAGLNSDVLPNTELYSEYRMRGNFTGRSMETASGIRGRYEVRPDLYFNPSFEMVDVLTPGGGEDSLAATLGVVDKRNPNRKLSGHAETRVTDSETYYGFRASWAQRISTSWTTLLREQFTLRKPDIGEMSARHRLTLGLAHRPKTSNRHHAVMMLSWEERREPEAGGDTRSFLLSTHQNRQLSDATVWSLRLGGKTTEYLDATSNDRSSWMLADTRLIHDFNRRWEGDVRAGWLGSGGEGGQKNSFGLGLSWIMRRNLMLSAAYNFHGFTEKSLDAEGYNREGFQLGLQMKFDEDWFQWLSE